MMKKPCFPPSSRDDLLTALTLIARYVKAVSVSLSPAVACHCLCRCLSSTCTANWIVLFCLSRNVVMLLHQSSRTRLILHLRMVSCSCACNQAVLAHTVGATKSFSARHPACHDGYRSSYWPLLWLSTASRQPTGPYQCRHMA